MGCCCRSGRDGRPSGASIAVEGRCRVMERESRLGRLGSRVRVIDSSVISTSSASSTPAAPAIRTASRKPFLFELAASNVTCGEVSTACDLECCLAPVILTGPFRDGNRFLLFRELAHFFP
jgi:hypothetical protein